MRGTKTQRGRWGVSCCLAVAIAGGGGRVWAEERVPGGKMTLDEAWAGLMGVEPEVARGVLRLAEDPAESVPFLGARLQPLTIEASEVRALIKDLGSEDDGTWHAAYEKLTYFDPRLAIDLPTLMDEVTDQPARNRLVALLSGQELSGMKGEPYEGQEVVLRTLKGDEGGYNFYSNRMSWWAESKVSRLKGSQKRRWMQAGDAILILEQVGTPEAVGVLQEMATGHPEAEPTKLAKEALERMAAAATQPSAAVEMEKWWGDLWKAPPVAIPALLKMSRVPEKSVAFLKGEMHPLTISADDVRALTKDLGSEDEAVWKPAFEKLSYYDPRLAVPLSQIFLETYEPLARERLVEVLMDVPEGTMKGKPGELRQTETSPPYYNYSSREFGSWGVEPSVAVLNTRRWGGDKHLWTRAERAEVLLGWIGTPEAVGILKEMAGGHAEAMPTKVAVEELKRVGSR